MLLILLASALIGGGSGCLTYLVLEWRQARKYRRPQKPHHRPINGLTEAAMRRAYDQSVADVVAVTGRGAFKSGPRTATWTDDEECWHQ